MSTGNVNPFFFLSSINEGLRGKHVMPDVLTDTSESGGDPSCISKSYVPFIINRGMSQHSDTIFFANEMNKYPSLHPRMQYDFLRAITPPKKRFSKWARGKGDEEVVEALKELFSYSNDKAREYAKILTEEQKKILIKRVDKGGKK